MRDFTNMSKIELIGISVVTWCMLLAGFASSAEAADSAKTIRVTSGSYKISGWQNQLIKGDPSLAHWTWCPMVGFKQGTMQVAQSKAYVRPKHVYTKPIHVATVLPKEKYNKPVQMVAGMLQANEKNVSAALSVTQTQAKIASYNDDTLANPEGEQSLQCNVYGKLMTQALHAHANRLSF